MNQMRIRLHNAEDTAELGSKLAAALKGGDVLALSGELGAGKTTLVRALAEALGVDMDGVSSPTFVLVNEYPNQNGPDLVHVDAYRAASAEDLESSGLDLSLSNPGSVVVIEWAERVAELLPADTLFVTLSHAEGGGRLAEIRAPRSWQSREGAEWMSEPEAEREDRTCPVTGLHVPADSPSWPYANEQARLADLYRWMSGQHQISRPVEQRDLEEGVD